MPDLVIIGSAIANSQNPVAVAKEMQTYYGGVKYDCEANGTGGIGGAATDR